MPSHPEHPIRQISCPTCYTDAELAAGITDLQNVKLPSAPGTKAKPKRTDSKPKKSSWMDQLIN